MKTNLIASLLSLGIGIFSAAAQNPETSDRTMKPLEIGASVPAVTAKNQDGSDLDFVQIGAKGKLLVYFYPKADTPGCTKQACSLRDSYAPLQDAGVTVIGVSQDSVADQKAFQEKYELPFMLAADTEAKVQNGFGVPEMRPGFASRQAFLFSDGKLIWRDLKASTDKQAADVMAALEAQKKE